MEPAKKMVDQVKQPEETSDETVVDQGRSRRRRSQIRSDIPVNMDELRELIQLVRENEFTEFELEREDFRVRFRKGLGAPSEAAPVVPSVPQPASSPAAATTAEPASPVHPGAKAETAASEDQGLHMISSPIVGTFYRSPSPNADSFVKIGSTVEAETVVCIIEAMKLMNEIQAETTGEVVKIYVENGQPVEYGQPLFGIKR